MKLRHWPKCQKLHIYPLSTLRHRNWAYFFSMGTVSEIRANFQNCHIWPWNMGISQSYRSCTYSLFLPREMGDGGRNWAYFCSTGSGFRDTGWFSKLPYLGQSARSSTYTLFLPHIYFLTYMYPWVPNFTPFSSAAAHFQDIGSFAFSHWPQC